jgi:ribosome maturation factor RimP
MSTQYETTCTLRKIIDPVIASAGYELVDVQFRRERTGWVVRVYVDGAGGISFDDCERLTHELSPVLDVHDPIPQAYSLEVSSPGIDRPLRTTAHFRQFVGEQVDVLLTRAAAAGRRKFKGTLVAVSGEDDAAVITIGIDGADHELRVADVEWAQLVPDWDAVLRGAAGNSPRQTR